MEKPSKPHLKLANPDTTECEPPRPLRAAGRGTWNRIQREYRILDSGGIELLMQICEGIYQIEELSSAIEADGGPVLRGRSGPKVHPAVRQVAALRAFVVRSLQKLGITQEPVKPGVGRPTGSNFTWTP